MPDRGTQTRLRAVDRAADARCRIYAGDLRAIVAVARAAGLTSVPCAAVEDICDLMDGRDPIPPPQSLDAWRERKEQ